MARRAYHHGDLRRALLDEALLQIERDGPGSVNLRDLARRVGVSHAAPYRHFQDKDELLRVLAEEGFARLADAVATEAARGRSPVARIRRAGVAYVELARSHPAQFRLMFGPERVGVATDAAPRGFQGLVGLMADCQEAGLVRRGGTEEKARMAWALVHGIAELAVAGQVDLVDAAATERFTLRAIDTLLEGLRPD